LAEVLDIFCYTSGPDSNFGDDLNRNSGLAAKLGDPLHHRDVVNLVGPKLAEEMIATVLSRHRYGAN
jgi:hypothetical protein